jgi:hypothetical protein
MILDVSRPVDERSTCTLRLIVPVLQLLAKSREKAVMDFSLGLLFTVPLHYRLQ